MKSTSLSGASLFSAISQEKCLLYSSSDKQGENLNKINQNPFFTQGDVAIK